MSTIIRISDGLAKKARIRAKSLRRSLPGQIEYWAQIGHIAEDNPDLSFTFIQNILLSREEAKQGELEPYVFGDEAKKAK